MMLFTPYSFDGCNATSNTRNLNIFPQLTYFDRSISWFLEFGMYEGFVDKILEYSVA